MKALNLVIVSIFLCSCDFELDFLKNDNLHIIPAGQHTSVESTFRGFEGNHLLFEAKFDKTAIYKTKQEANQGDINKLMGFSTCESHHHQNSARIGWRWYKNNLEIFSYVYIEGERFEEFIATVAIEDVVEYEITQYTDGYKFRVGQVEKFISVPSFCGDGSNYLLWPYFGGDETAPHDISILIESIKESSGSGESYKSEG